jgi:predicted XRE-type DNA-binding protein
MRGAGSRPIDSRSSWHTSKCSPPGFSRREAAHLLVRADLLIQVQKTITSRGLQRTKAAKTLQVPQSRISDLLHGRIDLFSTDALIDMLVRLGVGARLVVTPARSRRLDKATK